MPYPVKCFFESNEDVVQTLLKLKILFTQDSEVEVLLCGTSSGPEPSLFFGDILFSLEAEHIQDDFQL